MDASFEHDDQDVGAFTDYTRSPWGSFGRSATLGIVSIVSKLVMHVSNTLIVENQDDLMDVVFKREEGLGLITVSNHASTLDDPMLFCGIFPMSFFFTEHWHRRVRWSICAREMCYSNPLFAQFFKSGKTLPVERGGGLYQPVMHVVSRALARGDWVHVFPEGKIHFNDGKSVGPLKWGVGKVCCDSFLLSGKVPMVVPFHHTGMTSLMPKGSIIPRFGHTVHVKVGDRIELSDIIEQCKNETKEGRECAWKAITDRIGSSMGSLAEDMQASSTFAVVS